MGSYMYVCPSCRKIFKIAGVGKKAKCPKCIDFTLVDTSETEENWKTYDKDKRKKIIIDILDEAEVVEFEEPAMRNELQKITESKEYGTENEFKIQSGNLDSVYSSQVNPILLQALEHLIQPFMDISRIASEIDKVQKRIKNSETVHRKDTKSSKVVKSILLAFPTALFAAFIISEFIPGTGNFKTTCIIFLFLYCLCYVASVFVLKNLFDKETVKRKELIDRYHNQYKEKIEEINSICERLDQREIALIPPDYRYGYAIQFFYKALLNQRAINMQQAVNLYEDQMHKDRLEQMQAQQSAYLNSIKTSSSISAVANTANFLYKLF